LEKLHVQRPRPAQKQANHPKMHKLQKAISMLAVQKKCENPAKMVIFQQSGAFLFCVYM
jgi:hypothetical protein